MAKKLQPRIKSPPPARRRTFLKEWRKHLEMTLEEAAAQAGMSVGNLSAMERGAQNYTQTGLEALARVYRVEPGWLLEVDPNRDDSLLSVWHRAKPAEREQIVAVAKALTKQGS